ATADLAIEIAEIVLHRLQLWPFDAGGVAHVPVNQVDEAVNDRERAVDVVRHAGVDLAAGARDLLLHLLLLAKALQLLERAGVHLGPPRGPMLPDRTGVRRPHRGNVERLVPISTRPMTERRARGLERLVGGAPHHLDRRVEVLQVLAHYDPGHAGDE